MVSKPKAQSPPKPGKKAKAKEKPQRERFIEAARELGVDETGQEFEQLFDRVAKLKPPRQKRASEG